ncbi:DNA polymerase [Alishewanella phage vB_AspM_Slicko01]|nr:DNA polymerase [Alishewanella phage vB_AspM_Slicko01]
MEYTDFEEENKFWLPVEQVDGSIKMTKYHSNFQVAGDTDSCYMRIPEEFNILEKGEMIEFCDQIASITNDGFDGFCKSAFNMPESRFGTIAADREAVSDKSLFLSKKRYIMHLVNMEGKDVDKLKIMGVEIIKSDTSKFTKKILMDVVNMILDGKQREEVLATIKERKSMIYDAELHDLATPAGCRTILKAYKQLEETGGLKGIHFTARSAIFYNTLCGDKDQKIRAGDKIGIIYIKNTKSKYLGFPKDATYLPDWMDDIVIDYDTHWDKSFKKIENYLESMGWDNKSMTQSIRSNLFGIEIKPKTKGKKK